MKRIPFAALLLLACDPPHGATCIEDDELAKRYAEQFHVSGLACKDEECRGKIDPARAAALSKQAPEKGGLTGGCRTVSSYADARSSRYDSMSRPCCTWGGSACTMTYGWVVSEQAGEICIR